jgi:hypothetical protein
VKALTVDEQQAVSTTFKFRIQDLLNTELTASTDEVQQTAREQIDLLVSAAQKLELP